MRSRDGVVAGLIVVAVAVVVVFTSQGTRHRSSGTPDTEWAVQVCTSLSDWRAHIEGGPFTPSATIADAKAKYVARMTALDDATTTLVAALRHAGTPAAPDGPAIAAALVGKMEEMKELASQIASGAKALPTTNAASFGKAAAALSKRLSDEGKALPGSLDWLGDRYAVTDKELFDIMDNTAACQFLAPPSQN